MSQFRINPIAFVSMLAVTLSVSIADDREYELERVVAMSGFDKKTCWVHARAGAVPANVAANASGRPAIVMTMQKALLVASDVFYPLHQTVSNDLGQSWSKPIEQSEFERRKMSAETDMTVCDFTPAWHAKSKTLLGTGHTVWYRNNRLMHVRPRSTAYAVYDPATAKWLPWKRVVMPDHVRFKNSGAGSVQRLDLANGDVLLPTYYKDPQKYQYSTTVMHCSFDGKGLKYIRHGSELTIPVKRGLYEPSVTWFNGRFFLTMRNDVHGYVSVSDDGMNYSDPIQWKFDDGSDLGNYNTQQHWVAHHNALYLVYTRRGANNDRVFRHRAPLFIARVDPERLCVIRSTEQILVPDRGARLGNFAITRVSEDETWITVAEWMQPIGVEKHGSDNSVFVAKLKWKAPNRLFSKSLPSIR